MKILIVNFEYPPLGGGGGVATKQLAEYLAGGHEVHVLTTRLDALAPYEQQKNVYIHRVSVVGRRHLHAASMLSLVTFVPTALLRGWKLCQEHRFSVINAQFVLPSGLVGCVLSWLFAVPLVLTFIGGDIYDPTKGTSPHRYAVLRWLIRSIARRAQALTAISKDTKRRARSLHGVQGVIAVVPLAFEAVETDTPPAGGAGRESLGIDAEALLLISVGRLIARKGYHHLLQVLSRMEKVHLLIVGDGHLRSSLEAQAAALGVKDRLHFTGFVDEERKYALLKMADVYVSAAEHEGFGIVFLEAMWAGLPIVAFGNGGHEDFLQPERNAVLVPVGDVAALEAGIRRVADSDATRQHMAQANREDVQQFTTEATGQRYEEIFKEVARI